MAFYLAIDLGTTGCRSIVFDEALTMRASSYEEYGLITPCAEWVEQDAELWWTLTLKTAQKAIAEAGIDGREIDAVSVSSQGITIVPVDGRATPLGNAISWLDVRAAEQAETLRQKIGVADLFELSGKCIDPAYSLPKMMWLKKERPEQYQNAYKFLMPMDYLLAKLSGRFLTDHTMASGTLAYDMKAKTWNEPILRMLGIERAKLPDLVWSGEAVGTVLPEVAAHLSLREDCIVIAGAQDQRCASLAAGIGKGTMTISLGTAGAVCKLWDHLPAVRDMRIGWSAYIREDAWITEGVINTASVCLRWLRDIMYPDCDYDMISAEAECAQKRGNALIFYPYLSGASCPERYPDSTGCFYGATLATQRSDFALAVMEGVAFQIRILLEVMEAYKDVRTLVLFGGGSNSPFWCQLIADITQMRIQVPDITEAAGAGAAILAGIGAGRFDRMSAPRVQARNVYSPGPNKAAYEQRYQRYRALEKKVWGRAQA